MQNDIILSITKFYLEHIDTGNVSKVKNSFNNLINLYNGDNLITFFQNDFYKKFISDYINSSNSLNYIDYIDIRNFCISSVFKIISKKEKAYNQLCSYIADIEDYLVTNKDIDNETFERLVIMYTYIIASSKPISDYILKRIILKQNKIPRYLYAQFIETFGNELYQDGKVIISNNLGISDNEMANYDPVTKDILVNGKYLESNCLIDDICYLFHEMEHNNQHYHFNIFSYESYEIRKEMFVSIIIDNYDTNYWSEKQEYYAQAKAIEKTINYLSEIIPKEYIKLKNDYENTDFIKLDKIISLDELFDETIKIDKEMFLEKYKFFKYEYDQNGNRYLISYLLEKRNTIQDKTIQQFYNDLIYKHNYSYKEIIVNIADLIKNKKDKESKKIIMHLLKMMTLYKTKISVKNLFDYKMILGKMKKLKP